MNTAVTAQNRWGEYVDVVITVIMVVLFLLALILLFKLVWWGS